MKTNGTIKRPAAKTVGQTGLKTSAPVSMSVKVRMTSAEWLALTARAALFGLSPDDLCSAILAREGLEIFNGTGLDQDEVEQYSPKFLERGGTFMEATLPESTAAVLRELSELSGTPVADLVIECLRRKVEELNASATTGGKGAR